MGVTILDTLIAQARGAISRAYLVAGFVPALTIALGWQLYAARRIGDLPAQLEPLLSVKTTNLRASIVVQAMLVAVAGALFYGGRSLILRTFQEGPGGVFAFWRGHLLKLQVIKWWEGRRRQERDERRHTAASLITDPESVRTRAIEYHVPGSVAERLGRSRAAREYVERLAGYMTSGAPYHDELDYDVIVSGLEGYFSVDAASRDRERAGWIELYETEGGQYVLDRVRAEMARRALATLTKSSEQPDREEWLAPTRLGNRVAALDDYAERRYGIATAALWTRLWGTLGQAERQEITNAQLRVETLANMTVAFAALAAAAGAVSVYQSTRTGPADWWGLGFAAVCAWLAVASYNAAVHAFGGVADGIMRLVDLHRVRVLVTFGLVAPKTFAEERAMFSELSRLFHHADTSGVDGRAMRDVKPK